MIQTSNIINYVCTCTPTCETYGSRLVLSKIFFLAAAILNNIMQHNYIRCISTYISRMMTLMFSVSGITMPSYYFYLVLSIQQKAAVMWLKYWLYGVNPVPSINQSINQYTIKRVSALVGGGGYQQNNHTQKSYISHIPLLIIDFNDTCSLLQFLFMLFLSLLPFSLYPIFLFLSLLSFFIHR